MNVLNVFFLWCCVCGVFSLLLMCLMMKIETWILVHSSFFVCFLLHVTVGY